MQRIFNGALNINTTHFLGEQVFITHLVCPLCSGTLNSQGELPRCASCHISIQPVLVLEKPDVTADVSFWFVRLLLRDGLITPEQWQSIVDQQSLFVAPLCCPSCDRHLTGKDIDWQHRKISCCEVLILPRLRIKEIDTFSYQEWQPPSFNVGEWFIDIELLSTEEEPQTQGELKRINATAYRQELMRFLPHNAPVKDVRDLQSPDPSLAAVDTPTKKSTSLTDTADIPPPKKTQKMIDKEMVFQFLSAWVVESEGAITPRDVVYEKYQQWIRQQDREPVSDKLLYRQLCEVFPLVRVRQNRINGDLTRCFRGVKLHSDV